MTKRNDLLSYAPMTTLVFIMGLLYTVFMLTLVPPLGSNQHSYPVNSLYPYSDIVNVVVVNVFASLVLVSFLRASLTKPGAVPSIHPWDPDCPASFGSSTVMDKALAEKGFQNVRGLERKKDGRARFCRVCGKFKPDRAHHSSNMGVCVLSMDHYCPWIRNCVGYYNKKYFFLLIFWGSITLISVGVSLGPRFVHACHHMSNVLDFFIAFCWILSVLMAFVLTSFTMFHVWLMAKGFTTIEFFEKRRADESKVTKQGQHIRDLYSKSPYDISLYANIVSVLGPWWTWLIPTRYGMPIGIAAGCIFDINKDHPLYLATLNRNGADSVASSIGKMPNEEPGAAETSLLVGSDPDLDPIRPA